MTISYFLMLFFVFWTLLKLGKLYYQRRFQVADVTVLDIVLLWMWSLLGTFFFHCWL